MAAVKRPRFRDVTTEIGAPDNRIKDYKIVCSDAPGLQIFYPVT